MTAPNPQKLVRPLVQGLHPYVPGEQPKIPGLVKLNTNENPYPPSPKVIRAIKAAVDGRLRLYPDPSALALREKLAALHRCAPENIIVGNGSDELLTLAVRAFADPAPTPAPARSMVQYFTPSYSLYPVLAAIQGASTNAVPLHPDFTAPTLAELKRAKVWNFKAALSLVTTPNAPSGQGIPTSQLDALSAAQKGVLVLDEAYADFADENAMSLALKFPNVLVARTFSKGYSLCALRIGYMVGHPLLIAALHKIRDSYNVNALAQAAALATLDDLPHYQVNHRRVRINRDRFALALAHLGFEIIPSQTNFLFVKPPKYPAQEWLEKLRSKNILVRWFDTPATRDFLRITIGTASQMDSTASTILRLLR